MDNEEIKQFIVEKVKFEEYLSDIVCQIKDEDFQKKIQNVLKYLDCDVYNESTRSGFRIFARQLLEVISKK